MSAGRGAEVPAAQLVLAEPYAGESYEGRFSGFGKTVLCTGAEYRGEFDDGRRHGLGSMEWPDGLRYIGEWVDNAPHGLGCLLFPDNSEYYGDVVNGKRHGSGVHVDGSVRYIGEWSEGKRHGWGSQFSPSAAYSGEWVQGKRHGWGSIEFASLNRYAGEWKDDQIEGRGQMVWVSLKPASVSDKDRLYKSSHREWVGQMRKNLRNVGSVKPGPLGPFTPAMVASTECLEKYTGEWKAGRPHGRGEHRLLFHAHKTTRDVPFEMLNHFKGQFVNGNREGPGMQYFADGTAYEGTWLNNLKHGHGTMYHPDGSQDELEMENDSLANGVAPNRGTGDLHNLLKFDDLMGTEHPREKKAVVEVASRFSTTLRHLFNVYGALHIPIDFTSAEDLARGNKRTPVQPPLPQFAKRLEKDAVSIPATASVSQRDGLLGGALNVRVATDALTKAKMSHELVNSIPDWGEDDSGFGPTDEGMHRDFFDSTNASFVSASAVGSPNFMKSPLTRSRGGHSRQPSADPMGLESLLPAEDTLVQHAARRPKQLTMTSHNVFSLLSDAQVIDRSFSMAHVTACLEPVLTRLASTPNGRVLTYPAFVEVLLRVAEVKFGTTSPFFAGNSLRKITLSERFVYLLEEFITPLTEALKDLDHCPEFVALGVNRFIEESVDNTTLEEVRKNALRALKDKMTRRRRGHAQEVEMTDEEFDEQLGDIVDETMRSASVASVRPPSASGGPLAGAGPGLPRATSFTRQQMLQRESVSGVSGASVGGVAIGSGNHRDSIATVAPGMSVMSTRPTTANGPASPSAASASAQSQQHSARHTTSIAAAAAMGSQINLTVTPTTPQMPIPTDDLSVASGATPRDRRGSVGGSGGSGANGSPASASGGPTSSGLGATMQPDRATQATLDALESMDLPLHQPATRITASVKHRHVLLSEPRKTGRVKVTSPDQAQAQARFGMSPRGMFSSAASAALASPMSNPLHSPSGQGGMMGAHMMSFGTSSGQSQGTGSNTLNVPSSGVQGVPPLGFSGPLSDNLSIAGASVAGSVSAALSPRREPPKPDRMELWYVVVKARHLTPSVLKVNNSATAPASLRLHCVVVFTSEDANGKVTQHLGGVLPQAWLVRQESILGAGLSAAAESSGVDYDQALGQTLGQTMNVMDALSKSVEWVLPLPMQVPMHFYLRFAPIAEAAEAVVPLAVKLFDKCKGKLAPLFSLLRVVGLLDPPKSRHVDQDKRRADKEKHRKQVREVNKLRLARALKRRAAAATVAGSPRKKSQVFGAESPRRRGSSVSPGRSTMGLPGRKGHRNTQGASMLTRSVNAFLRSPQGSPTRLGRGGDKTPPLGCRDTELPDGTEARQRVPVDDAMRNILFNVFASEAGVKTDAVSLVDRAAPQPVIDPQLLKLFLKRSPELASAVQMLALHQQERKSRQDAFRPLHTPLASGLWWAIAETIDVSFEEFLTVLVELAVHIYHVSDFAATQYGSDQSSASPLLGMSVSRMTSIASGGSNPNAVTEGVTEGTVVGQLSLFAKTWPTIIGLNLPGDAIAPVGQLLGDPLTVTKDPVTPVETPRLPKPPTPEASPRGKKAAARKKSSGGAPTSAAAAAVAAAAAMADYEAAQQKLAGPRLGAKVKRAEAMPPPIRVDPPLPTTTWKVVPEDPKAKKKATGKK